MLILFPREGRAKFPPAKPLYLVNNILHQVVRVTGETRESMISHNRGRGATYARHLAWYVLKNHGGQFIADIGRLFGNRDHSTIIKGIKRIELELQTRDETRSDYQEILTKLSI